MPPIDDPLKRFNANLERSERVDMAVAWATSGSALEWLEDAASRRGVSVPAIVGTYGNATDPDALERLEHIGKPRLVSERGAMFHPKIYIFRGDQKSMAWIGSANFTRGGIEANEEAVFETTRIDSVSRWFTDRWRECGKLSPNAIADYRRRRRLNPPPRVLGGMTGKLSRGGNDRLAFLDQADDWSGHLAALRQCHDWWSDHPQHHWTVSGDTNSWTHTIENVHPIATNDWRELEVDDARKLLGMFQDEELDSGLLGNMQRAKKAANVFLESTQENLQIRKRIKRAADRVVNAHATSFPGVAIEAIRTIREEDGFGLGVATRILSLARPDKVVSLNGGSIAQLAKVFPSVEKIRNSNDYGRFLDQLYQEPWFDSNRPKDPFERRLWSMRAALLDSFVYTP